MMNDTDKRLTQDTIEREKAATRNRTLLAITFVLALLAIIALVYFASTPVTAPVTTPAQPTNPATTVPATTAPATAPTP